jgi:hypothetical protein
VSYEPIEFILADDTRPAERPIVAVICSAGIPGVASRAATDTGTRRSVQPTPDTNGLSDGGEVIPLRSAVAPDPPEACDLALMREVIDAGTHSEDPASGAQAILDAITRSLDLSSGTIALLDVSEDGARRLVPTASSGPQSPLLRDMPPIDVESSYEAAVVFAESEPHYVADMHGEGSADEQAERAEDSESVGRWRSLISTKSYAVLPLCAGPRPIGVMTLQWPDSREFDDHTTEMLETVAAIAAVSLAHCAKADGTQDFAEQLAEGATGGASSEDTSSATAIDTMAAENGGAIHTPVGPLRLEVTPDGVLMPLAPDASGNPEALLSLEVTLSDAACVVWDASTPHHGVVAVLIASFAEAETAGALRERLVQTKRVCSRQDMSLSQTLALLNGVVVASTSPGTAVPAWVGWIDAHTGALTHCGAGDTDVVVHSASGRTWAPELNAPPLGSSGQVACEQDIRLLLPGDRVMVRLGDAELRVSKP